MLADQCDGRPLGFVNDLWLAPGGDIYFTMPRIKDRQRKSVPEDVLAATVCRIAASDIESNGGRVEQVGFGLKSCNGITGSLDGKTLYVADPGSRNCWRYTIDNDGQLFDQRLAAPEGSDGLAVDREGNLYVTAKEGLHVYAPDATLLLSIPMPESPANMAFGGPDGDTLLVTARTSVYKLRVAVPGAENDR